MEAQKKDVNLDGIILVTGPDMSGCNRGIVVYDAFTSYARSFRRTT